MSSTKASLFSVIGADIKDRLKGNKSRANARLGLVNPPEGKSKLIWIRAGQSRDSVLLAAGLMAAIRHKRLDVRLVLTYEKEYQDVIIEQLSGLEKIGFGYACADTVSTELRMLKRLDPFAIIFAGKSASDGVIQALQKQPVKHILNFQSDAIKSLSVEASYPNISNIKQTENTFEAMTLLMQSQVDVQLGALLKGSETRELFLISSPVNRSKLDMVLENWKQSDLSNRAILCIYAGDAPDTVSEILDKKELKKKYFSQWDRETAANNEIFVIDEWRWFAATAASATAIHLLDYNQLTFWQSLASATVLSLDDGIKPTLGLDLPHHGEEKLVSYWESLSDNAFLCRKLGDENRRQFWSQRRLAQEQIDKLLQRVYDW